MGASSVPRRHIGHFARVPWVVRTPFLLDDALARGSAAVTAQEIVDRVKKNVGVEWAGGEIEIDV